MEAARRPVDCESGDDLLFGGSGNDAVSGGNGNDEIWGGPCADILTGNAGVDPFGFAGGSDNDVISDFVPGVDFLDLRYTATDFTSVGSVLANSLESFTGLVINLDGGDDVVLDGLRTLDSQNGLLF